MLLDFTLGLGVLIFLLNLNIFAIADIYNKMPVYQIVNGVKGTFHQDDNIFGNTAGRQCAYNALYSIFWSNICPISRWEKPDLDKILTEGDRILYYTSH